MGAEGAQVGGLRGPPTLRQHHIGVHRLLAALVFRRIDKPAAVTFTWSWREWFAAGSAPWAQQCPGADVMIAIPLRHRCASLDLLVAAQP